MPILARGAVAVGEAVRDAIAALPYSRRALRACSVLKPPPGDAALPDVVGEAAAWVILQDLSGQLGGVEIRAIINLELYHSIWSQQPLGGATGDGLAGLHVWCYLDAVDGTTKVAGLNNKEGRFRAANDGSWAVGVAFTELTVKPQDELCISDFKVSAIVDGTVPSSNATSACYPTAVIATAGAAGSYITSEGAAGGPHLHTSSNTTLSQSFAYLDSFQAFDRSSQRPGDEALACALYAELMDRNGGGAFDVLRTYGNLSALQRNMLGWRGGREAGGRVATEPGAASEGAASEGAPDCGGPLWFEAQCGGFLVVNENLSNLIPAVPVVLGAGGIATDFEGRPLLHRRLSEGRCNVVYAGNAELHAILLSAIQRAKNVVIKS